MAALAHHDSAQHDVKGQDLAKARPDVVEKCLGESSVLTHPANAERGALKDVGPAATSLPPMGLLDLRNLLLSSQVKVWLQSLVYASGDDEFSYYLGVILATPIAGACMTPPLAYFF